MTTDQITALGSALASFVAEHRACFATAPTFKHCGTYCRGLMSDLPRKSVEPIALAGGTAVRTLQEFLTHHDWDHARLRDQLQQRIVRDHLSAPASADASASTAGSTPADDLGTVGWTDETSVPKKGDKTPGVQRQYCGHSGKIDNCMTTVHLAARRGNFMTLLDSDLFLPEKTWHDDRANGGDRCKKAHIPDDVVYRSKWKIALEQIRRAMANGVRFDWLTFDEWYGGKPGFLAELDEMGQRYVCEVPRNFLCWPTRPRYCSKQSAFAPKRVDNAARRGGPFRGQKWKTCKIPRKTLPDQVWRAKAGLVHLVRDGKPTDRRYWLIVAENIHTGEVKHFIANADERCPPDTLLRVAFTRAGVEHVFRLAKTEIGFDHYEGRTYHGLMRHMMLCQLVLTFIAEHTDRLRGEKSGLDDGADRPRPERLLPPVAGQARQAIFT